MSTRKRISLVIFLAITLVAAVSLISSTMNYIEFFTAVRTIDLAVSDVQLAIGQDTANITLIYAVINPTSYTGLRLRELSHELSYKEAGSELEPAGLEWWTSSYRQQPKPLNGYSNITFEDNIFLSTDSARAEETERFLEFYENHQQSIMWVLKCSAIFISFAGNIVTSLAASRTATYG